MHSDFCELNPGAINVKTMCVVGLGYVLCNNGR